jgi:hypothetical protein
MKKILFAAVGLSAIAAAAPAAAQGYPGYGYNQPYGQAYGYNYGDQQGVVRSYLIRADQLRRQVDRLDNRDRINEREARRLRAAAADLQNRTRAYAQNGLSGRERAELDQRFAQLQQALRRDARDGRGQWGNQRDRDWDGVRDRRDGWIDANRNGIDDRQERGSYYDRDRDGRDDRYEDDRGQYPG